MSRKPTGKSAVQIQTELRQRMTGDANPMRRPEVAAKVAAAVRSRICSDAAMRAVVEQNLAKGRNWTPERKAAASERSKRAWTPEMREVARTRSAAYQERVRAALAASPIKV